MSVVTTQPRAPDSADDVSAVLQGYKRTDMGVIPHEWEVVPLSKLSAFITKGATPTTFGFTWEQSGVLFLRSECVSDDGLDLEQSMYISSAADDALRRSAVRDGDILITITGNVGRVVFLNGVGSANINQHIARIRIVAAGVDVGYVYNYLSQIGVRRKLNSITTGQAYPQISLHQVREAKIVLPPSSEQRAIAEALSDADGLLGALEALIAKKRAIKQAAMQQLLTGKTRLPGFSGEWETKRLGRFVTFLRHGVHSRAELTSAGAVRYLHYGDIHTSTDVRLDPAVTLMPRLAVDRARNLDRLEDGDLVLVDASEDTKGVGKSVEVTGVTGVEVVAGLHTIAARFDKAALADGFKAYLQFYPSFRTHLKRLAAGTKVYATNRAHIASVEMQLPGTDEQTAIATILSDMDAEITVLQRRRDKTRAIKQGMMQQLLTGRVRLVAPEVIAGQPAAESKTTKAHGWAFNEAVVISMLARHFGSERYPLGRKRYTKLSYLLHRHAEKQPEGYLKKAAGPYNPKTRYGGPEKIAQENKYIRAHKNGQYSGFIAADSIAQAEGYFEKWYGPGCIQWLEQFRLKKNDELEVLATVDMAVEELHTADKNVNVDTVKDVIRSHPEWREKLDQSIFSDADIASAVEACRTLFDRTGKGA